MKHIAREKLLFLLIFILLVILVINAGQKLKQYYVFNSSSGKLYRYQQLAPGEKYTWESSRSDSVTIISRLIIESEMQGEYSYKAFYRGEEHLVTRSLRFSKVSRGVNGEKVTSWNSYRFDISAAQEKVVITNTTGHDLLVKVKQDGKKIIKKYQTEDRYIAYPPDTYDNLLEVVVKEKEYTYYQGNETGLALELEGPLNLKIINRLIIGKVDGLTFSWRVLLDNQEILLVSDSLPFSQSCLIDSSSNVTRGLVNILNIPKGKHNIQIIDEQPSGILYRLYISKSAIGN
jgi:hypothetical protein